MALEESSAGTLKENIGKYVLRVIYEVAELYDVMVFEPAVTPVQAHLFISAQTDDSPAAFDFLLYPSPSPNTRKNRG
jgi:hypothetical protein